VSANAPQGVAGVVSRCMSWHAADHTLVQALV
jgi:hypothetical protein